MNVPLGQKTQTKEERCSCGKLLLKKLETIFEVKCPRCKRIHIIDFRELMKCEARDLESKAQKKGGV